MRTVIGSLVLILGVLLAIVFWLFDAEGARIAGATLAMAAGLVAVGVLLDAADPGTAKRDAEVR